MGPMSGEAASARSAVYHYTSFDRAERILAGGGGLDPSFGQWVCHEYPPGRTRRALRALVDPAPRSWRASPVFGEYIAMLMGLLEDRLCLEVEVGDDEGFVVDRAHVEGYMCGHALLSLPGPLPPEYRWFRRDSAEAAMLATRAPISRPDLWSAHLLPKVLLLERVEPPRVRVAPVQPYLFDRRWASEATRRRAEAFVRRHPESAAVLDAAR